jgi:hypothetical protein
MSFQDTTPQENVTQAILPADRIVCVTFSEEEVRLMNATVHLIQGNRSGAQVNHLVIVDRHAPHNYTCVAWDSHMAHVDLYGVARKKYTVAHSEDNNGAHSSLVDAVTDAIQASKKVRLGSRPNVQSCQAIRNIVQYWMEHDQPIPFLVPWGSEKPHGTGVDLAEIAALTRLEALQERVQSLYRPGVQINIRVEDTSGWHLFFHRKAAAQAESHLYTSGLVTLIEVMGLRHFIKPVPESALVSEEQFFAAADPLVPLFVRYLEETEFNLEDYEQRASYRALVERGWVGVIPIEQRLYYYQTLDRLYRLDPAQKRETLARYFAESLARHQLKILGDEPAWQGNYVQLSFVQPIPGEPQNRTTRRVYYRTAPGHVTTNHIPPWRAKGYLKSGQTEWKLALASWREPNDYQRNDFVLSNGEKSVLVQADYVLPLD